MTEDTFSRPEEKWRGQSKPIERAQRDALLDANDIIAARAYPMITDPSIDKMSAAERIRQITEQMVSLCGPDILQPLIDVRKAITERALHLLESGEGGEVS